MKTNIGIIEEHLVEITQMLSDILSDEFVLNTKALNY